VNEAQVVEYLRSRGQAEPPPDLTRSVMSAVGAAPAPRSWFSAYLPAVAVAGAVAIVAVVAILLGQGDNVGPAPTPSAKPASVEELQAAVREAVDRLRESPGVEGVGTAQVFGELGSATWFSWRPGGDQVVINRSDVDVTQTGWWLDREGGPPARGENVTTVIQVLAGDAYYRAAGEVGGEQGWTVEDRSTAPAVLAIPFPAVLDGRIDPWQDSSTSTDDGEASVRHFADGGAVWTLTMPFRSGSSVEEFDIGPDGALRAISRELVDVEPSLEDAPLFTSGSVELTALADADPILPPDVDGQPDPADFGLPADFPLATSNPETTIDYRAYVADALDALETYHWNSANIDWAAARSAALDGLPEAPDAAQAHQRIRDAIQTFDSFGTVFVRPQDVPPDGIGPGDPPDDLPVGERIGSAGYISIPSFTAPGAVPWREYLALARAEMEAAEAASPACGWIVDLRDHASGSWGPSILALAGLIGEGRAITFSAGFGEWALVVDADGAVSVAEADELDDPVDSPYIHGALEGDQNEGIAEVIADEPPYRPSVTGSPVAVLVGSGTVRGGEQTLVAFLGRPDTRVFGAPTGGSPVVEQHLPMVDGAVLRVPIWVPVDRDGTRYTENIFPDEVIGDTRAGGSDAILDAAVAWLEGQSGCS